MNSDEHRDDQVCRRAWPADLLQLFGCHLAKTTSIPNLRLETVGVTQTTTVIPGCVVYKTTATAGQLRMFGQPVRYRRWALLASRNRTYLPYAGASYRTKPFIMPRATNCNSSLKVNEG